jgi:hypothetical protein
MTNTINEILKEAEDNIASILKHGGNKYLAHFMDCAFIPERKMKLPAGVPPYKANNMHEQQLRGTFWQIAKKMDIFWKPDVPAIKREMAFIGALESLPEVEAKIFLAAKEQEIHKLFKGVTLEALIKVGYIRNYVIKAE